MITLGFFENIDNHPKIVFAPNILRLENTPSSSVVITPFNIKDISSYETYKDILGVIVYSLKEFIVASKCGVKYAIANDELAKQMQKTADNYLYDTRVLVLIENEDEIELVAIDEIDGVINQELLL